ncbi:MAG: hypothetical protein K0R38_3273 [Polyangiaceae bacterium]|jgi:hypothetical protein|nr:hypothetical protein [Polyangiaceae bacterium]
MRAPALIAALSCLSCAATTVRSGEAPGRTAAGYEERWHPGFLFGTVPGRDRYDLSRVCPNGWAEIRVEADPFTVFAGAITLFVYSPSRVTVVCARQAGDENLAF